MDEASAWAQAEKITCLREWKIRIKAPHPSNIPKNPPGTYGQAFKDAGGYGGFFGTGFISVRKRIFLPYQETKAWVLAQGIRTSSQWQKCCREPGFRPGNIPANLPHVYQDVWLAQGGWAGFFDRPSLTSPAF